MFENLTERLSKTFRNVVGRGKLSDENMKETLREVKKALLEADVALEVVKEFVNDLKEVARGLEVKKSLTPAQTLVKLVNDKLVEIMGEKCESLDLRAAPPVVVLMAGLQGSGKTTSTAKLAKWLSERQNKKALLASCDIYRPAAIAQLERLAQEVGADFYQAPENTPPVSIAQQAIDAAKKQNCDVVIIDTAGRLHIDDAMMAEIKAIHQAIKPTETLFVVDGMTGQDAAKTAKSFNDALPLTGVVITKMDGDARGGAVLSIKKITDKPIKFIGMGEKIDALEPFHPDRMASRILGMGDILSLVEELERKIDKGEAERLSKKIQKGKGFDFEDFRSQIMQMKKMGGLASLMDKLPGMGALPTEVKSKANDKVMDQMLAIINSMTKQERKKPIIIKGSRKKRIALGSGTSIQDVNRALKQFEQMQKMMKKLSQKGGMAKMMRGMKDFDKLMPPSGMN
ncbi:signal recognition particle protein [Candidatus Berkiella cookevillensis]|uniref:Signal recognition particle protein n=1 Tax=Candidatus Berkiella cookevillensis TaxID=437022 RepID=A0A0Q9YSV9_9GAMM|nr:signal recognition particle protein [Candidatus Berkiella cookevillensis]MCS5709425.1 signal recognition particle protein [Candidatus Berkiella cookevillensis]